MVNHFVAYWCHFRGVDHRSIIVTSASKDIMKPQVMEPQFATKLPSKDVELLKFTTFSGTTSFLFQQSSTNKYIMMFHIYLTSNCSTIYTHGN